MIAGAKIRDNSAKIKECRHNTKKLYNLVNNITGRVKPNPMPPWKTNLELADDFAGFFLEIREDLAGCATYSPTPIEVSPLSQFQHMSVDEVTKIIRKLHTTDWATKAIT